mmetsp:Transcript_22072/g.36981  ORF Transcript_22072/g.36981 Transcript_22072/m.36981 type:complete len:250 (+) Transcript_22072:119-868(+)
MMVKAYEWQFYNEVQLLPALLPFVPRFFGVAEISSNSLEAAKPTVAHHSPEFVHDVPASLYIVLEDLTKGMLKPCVLDLKMGTRQHEDETREPKKSSMIMKCRISTSGSHGVRLSGMMMHTEKNGFLVRLGKKDGLRMSLEELEQVLRDFCVNSETIYGKGFLAHSYLERLKQLLLVMQMQNRFRFYSSSLLLVYESHAQVDPGQKMWDLKMVDFAHALPVSTETTEALDNGYICGLETLVAIFTRICQ